MLVQGLICGRGLVTSLGWVIVLWSSTGYHIVIISLSTQCINGHWQTVRDTVTIL